MKVLVTGAAGFIGYHVSRRLLSDGHDVTGIDNLNPYYAVELKHARLERLQQHRAFTFHPLDISDRAALVALFADCDAQRVVHLAAQAGVRHSLHHPHDYVDTNLVGLVNVLEGCRHNGIDHLVFASSSSVYGGREQGPFKVDDRVDRPISLYAATKKAGELMAYSYSHLYALPVSCLRFFTVYGPWGRPDMAYFKFTTAIESGRPIEVYNEGKMARDFTYIDDVVEGVVRVLMGPPQPSTQTAPCRVYNIGRGKPVELLEFIKIIEKATGKKALKTMLPMQPGDVPVTWADVTALVEDHGYQPTTSLEEGIGKFVRWYHDHWSK